jgi:hypothetical protein
MEFDKRRLTRDIRVIINKYLKRHKVSYDKELHTKFDIDIDTFGNVDIKMPNYLIFADKGRKAGNPPPIKDIATWLKRKGIGGEDSESKAYAIAAKIAKRGFRGKNFLEPMNKEIIDFINNNLTNYIKL